MLTFEPKFHTQISEGEFAGAWIANMPLPTFSRMGSPDFIAKEGVKESARIEAEGGSVVVIDPMGSLNALKAACENETAENAAKIMGGGKFKWPVKRRTTIEENHREYILSICLCIVDHA